MKLIKKILGTLDEQSTPKPAEEGEITLAVCALLVEMGKIDGSFTEDQIEHVVSTMVGKFDLSREDANELISEADRELTDSVDLWQFAKIINENYSTDQKERLIERLWEIVYVDGRMDKHEHYLMNKVSKLIRISHRSLIEAKVKVLHS